jgi:hypothetical protein
MPSKELIEAQKTVELALKLLDSETADGIIGSPQPEEYGTLIRGTQAAFNMLWMMAKGNGMRENPDVLRMGAQGQAILLTLVHYAYALGVRQGQQTGGEK